MITWLGFSLAILLLLYLSRRNLALGMAAAAFVLATFTLSFSQMGEALLTTFGDPSVLLLAFVVGTIPMIGGSLEVSGEMDRLMANMRIGQKASLALSPALLGMLPMPGGALLSAPLVEKGAPHAAPDIKAAANVWFRHALLLVYPLGSALIASAKIAELDVYRVIPFLAPAFFLTLLLGYVFLLRNVRGRLTYDEPFSLRGLLVPLMIILVAPLLDLVLKQTIPLPYSEVGTATGVTVSFLAAVAIGGVSIGSLKQVFYKMRPWKYALIILAMFVFLNVFKASGVPERLASMSLPPVVLCIVIGVLLGLVTGRIQAPMSIIVPIFFTTYGVMSPWVFALTFFAVFLGYVLTPIHPCISVSIEYFGTSMSSYLRKIAPPATFAALLTLVVAIFTL
jgi:integral membrane protein (TIGR00529 family)